MVKHRYFIDFNSLAMRILHMPSIEIKSEDPKFEFMAYLIFDNIWQETQAVDADRVEVILACDAHDGYWRKELYPPYKADRVKNTEIDWERAYKELDNLKKVLALCTPWKVMQVPHCEADDIIATLTRASKKIPCTVHSGDSDFIQLVSENIRVYNPHYGDYVEFPSEIKISNGRTYVENTDEFLKLCILTGQGGKDNVYNCKTPTEWVPTEQSKRKPPLGLKGAIKILDNPEEFSKYAELETYHRNRNLIDFNCIPYSIKKSIVDAYKEYPKNNPDVTRLFTEYNWPSYMGIADEVAEAFNSFYGGEDV